MSSLGMCLSQQVEIFKEALENNINVQSLQNKIVDTRAMNDNLEKYVNRFKTLVISYQLLRGYSPSETISFNSETLHGRFLYAQLLLDNVKKVWQTKKEQLRQHENFPDLLNHLEVCCDELKEHLEQNWYKCVEVWKSRFLVPNALLNDISNIPVQNELCLAYSELLTRFNLLVKNLPQQKGTLLTIEKCVEELTELQSKMEFNIPENVKSFFANFTPSSDTVSLQLLTPEVFQWLHNKKLLNNFSIKRNWKNA